MSKFFGSDFARTLDRAGLFVLLVPVLLMGAATATIGLPL
jgi:hypothetical protein